MSCSSASRSSDDLVLFGRARRPRSFSANTFTSDIKNWNQGGWQGSFWGEKKLSCQNRAGEVKVCCEGNEITMKSEPTEKKYGP